MRPRRSAHEGGLTLVEVVTGTFVATLVLGVVLAVFLVGRGTWRSARSSYLLSREMGTALLQLRRDLEETSLGSVRVQNFPPGLSMATARDYGREGELVFQPSGAPRWTGHVLYALEPQGPDRSNLVRWVSAARPATLPLPSALAPWPVQGAVRRQVLMRNLLPKGRALREVGGRWTVVDDPDSLGGFVPRFVRRGPEGRSLSLDNPAAFSDGERPGWSAGNTLLVQVDLKVLEVDEESGAPSYMEFDLRAVPRN